MQSTRKPFPVGLLAFFGLLLKHYRDSNCVSLFTFQINSSSQSEEIELELKLFFFQTKDLYCKLFIVGVTDEQ